MKRLFRLKAKYLGSVLLVGITKRVGQHHGADANRLPFDLRTMDDTQ
jgi:hypothetical protein